MLQTLSLKCKLTVTVPKLRTEIIDGWLKKTPSWKNIDPYSSLEEVASTDASETEHTHDSNEGLHFSRVGGHCLCTRKRMYSNDHPHHSTTNTRFYRDMCTEPLKKRKRTSLVSLHEPSKKRIAAQRSITRNKTLPSVNSWFTRSYPSFQSKKQETTDPMEEDNTPAIESDDSDTTIILSPDSDGNTSDKKQVKLQNEKIVKCDVKTHTIGIMK